MGHQIEIFYQNSSFIYLHKGTEEVDTAEFADVDDDRVDIAELFDNPPPETEEEEGVVEAERKLSQAEFILEQPSYIVTSGYTPQLDITGNVVSEERTKQTNRKVQETAHKALKC